MVDRNFVLPEPEKEHFTLLMREAEEFSEVEILTYSVLTNHFHILVAVPRIPEPAVRPNPQAVLDKLSRLSGHQSVDNVRQRFEALRKANDQAGEAALLAKYHARIWDIRAFMQLLKQRFTQWVILLVLSGVCQVGRRVGRCVRVTAWK